MVINKKMKRLLCLALVCLMLTPIISFATTDSTDANTENTGDTTVDNNTDVTTDDTTAGNTVTTTTEGTWIDTGKSNASEAATVPEEDVLAEKEFLNLPYYERQAISKEQAIVATSKEDIEGHSYVCSGGGYELYLYEEKMSIIIRDEETGAILRSTLTPTQAVARNYTQTMYDTVTSGVLVQPITYNKDASTSRFGNYSTGILTPLKEGYVSTEELKEDGKVVGFTAHINFTEYGFEFDIIVKLTEEGALSWEIPEDTIKETNENYLMADLYVFPLLGYTDRGDRDGYMILPDGNGITIDYDDYFQDGEPKYKTAYLKRVYGSDVGLSGISQTTTLGDTLESSRDFTTSSEEITIPYFGVVHSDTQIAMVGIIEEGEYGGYIHGMINGINRSFENYVSTRFEYRTLYQEFMDNVGSSERWKTSEGRMIGDIKVTYLLTSGEDATYSGLANKLRSHLLNTGIINANEDQEFDVRLDFLGVDKENFMVFRRNVVATTAEDIRDILGQLSELGVTNVLAVYEGWQDDGVYNVPIYEFDADSDVGGNKAIEELISDLEEGGTVSLYLMQDMLTINTSMTSSVYTSINGYTGKTYERYEMYNEVFTTFRYLYPHKSEEYIKDITNDFLDSGIKNAAFSGISDNMFVYIYDKKEYTRQDTMEHYANAIKDSKDNGMSIILESPYMYLWKYTDAYLDFTIGSSMYVYASHEIPFLSSVLKGSLKMYSEYINFEANSTEYFLKLVETGVLPSFLITKESPEVLQYTNSNWNYSSEYDKYEDTIAEYYSKLKEINDKVQGEYIVNHEKLDSDVSITTYSNGVKVYVNFSDVDVTVDGMTIEAESYSVR